MPPLANTPVLGNVILVIDEVKVRLPIWKKEHYADGDSGWVNCERCAAHGHRHG